MFAATAAAGGDGSIADRLYLLECLPNKQLIIVIILIFEISRGAAP